MSVGTIGTIRPSDVKIEDIDIYYNYMINRNTYNNDMFKLESNDVLDYCYLPSDDDNAVGESLLEGLYNLKLPSNIFNKLGIYTLYIKPKTIINQIIDCGVLYSMPNVKGIILNIGNLPSNLKSNNSLQGYRIEYLDNSNNKIRNVVRYVVSSNKVSITTDNVSNMNQKSNRYRFDDSGNLLFLQLTPSSSSELKPNISPFIGNIGQNILISNTYFSPITLEIEMVDNNIETIANLIAGEQVKDVKNGILTYYNSNREIIKQFNLFEIKDDVTDVSLFEVKEKRNSLDLNQEFNEIIGDITYL